MSDLVEQKKRPLLKNIDDKVYNDFLDEIICALVRARDMIAQVQKQQQIDLAAAEYVASSLDCIESYSYDLIQYYPGGWSTVIQDQVIRTQEAYAQEIVPLITR